MNDIRIFKCLHCGKIIELLSKGNEIPTICCGDAMTELKANSTDAALEKHVPVIEINGNDVKVTIGSTIHPMIETHYIEFIYLITTKGVYRKDLRPNEEPIATFKISEDEKVLKAYEYCNLHGLWVKEL